MLRIKITDLSWNVQQTGGEMNKITGIVAGQYGNEIPLTIVDEDGTAVDVSSYTTITVKVTSFDGQKTLSYTGSFDSDGSDGKIAFTPTSTSTFDRDGTWKGQVQFAATNILAPTVLFDIEVERKI